MALDFPASPTDGQVFGSYVWSASKGVWQSREESAAVAIVSPTIPASANNGDIWYNSSRGIPYVYYDDGTSEQWVEIVTSGTPELSTKANLSGGNSFTGVQTFGTPIAVSSGGTGASTLTGYVKGNGTSALTASSSIPFADISSYSTQSSGSAYLNYWGRICRVIITGQYGNQAMSLNLVGEGPGNQTTYSARLKFRVKQQLAFGSNPYVELMLEDSYPIANVYADKFVAVIIQNTPTTIVELYAQLPVTYFNWYTTPVTRSPANASASTVFYNSDTLVVSVPAGTQISCTKASLNVVYGGTGTSSLTSGTYLKGAGTSAITTQTGIPAGDITSGTINKNRMPAGSVLQVLSKSDTTQWSSGITANSWYNWPSNRLQLSITPISTSSKILIIVNVDMGNNSNDAAFRILRGATVVGVGDANGSRLRASGVTGMLYASDLNHTRRVVTVSYLDSPATTSATTYNIQYASEGGVMYVNRAPNYQDSGVTYAATGVSTITLMEVAG